MPPPNQNPSGAPADADTFSTRFSELAQRTLNEASPMAAKKQVGFQLVNRNEAGDRACGVFGIDLGGKLSLAPVFFLNGETKMDSLVHTDPDLFVPLTDDWVRAALRDSIDKVGEPVDRTQARKFQRALDLRPVMNPGYRKVAGVTDPFVAIEFAKLCDRMQKRARHVPQNLPEFLESAGLPYYGAFAKLAVKYPQILPAVDRVFGEGTTQKIAARTTELMTKKAGDPMALPGADPAAAPTFALGGQPTAAPPREVLEAPTPAADPAVAAPHPTLQTPEPVEHIPDPVADQLGAMSGWYHQHAPSWLTPSRLAIGLGAGLAVVGAGAAYAGHKKRRVDPHTGEDMPGEEMDVASMSKVAGQKASSLANLLNGKKHADEEGEVAVVTPRSVARMHSGGGKFPDNIMGDVATKGYSAKDTRKSAAKAVKENDVSRFYTQSPTESGFYDVLMSDGYKRLLVLFPTIPNQSSSACLVVDPSSKEWDYVPAGDVVIKPKEAFPQAEEEKFRNWAADCPKFKGMPTSYDKGFLLVSPDGKCWGPFNGNGGETDRHAYLSCIDPRPSTAGSRIAAPYYGNHESLCLTHVEGAEGNKPVIREKTLYVPKGVGSFEFDKSKRTLDLAGPQALLDSVKYASAPLLVKKVANKVRINGHSYDPQVAPVVLMVSWDLREKQAQDIIKEGGSYRVFPPSWMVDRIKEHVKAGFDFGTFAPPVPEQEFVNEQAGRQALPTAYRQETSQSVTMPGQPPPHWDPWAAEDQQTIMSHATQGAKDNPEDKSNFSTASIAAMLDEVDGPEAAARGSGDLMKAIDQLGRDLFLLRWHRDSFDSRYGTGDARKLEELVRANFLQLGKTHLRLNQKGVGESSSYEERD